MTTNIKTIQCPIINLNISTIETAARYHQTLNCHKIWWSKLQPGFWWPFNIQQAFAVGPKPPLFKSYIGYQHLTTEKLANCSLRFMAIQDLSKWGPAVIDKKQRSVIRRGCERTTLQKIEKFTHTEASRALACWNNLVERTGWRKKMSTLEFSHYWRNLPTTPGQTIIGAYQNQMLIGWLLGTLYHNGYCYINRYASDHQYFNLSVNNALIYCFLLAAQAAGARIVNFGLFAPQKPSLDKFKEHLGFKKINFPAYLHLSPLAKLVLNVFKPKKLERITGWSGNLITNKNEN